MFGWGSVGKLFVGLERRRMLTEPEFNRITGILKKYADLNFVRKLMSSSRVKAVIESI